MVQATVTTTVSRQPEILLTKIVAELDKRKVDYFLMLSGRGLGDKHKGVIANHPRMQWLGFVDDFYAHLDATDIMLNPIWKGGGVKIKLMEALANNT